jgi:hypothetical protein
VIYKLTKLIYKQISKQEKMGNFTLYDSIVGNPSGVACIGVDPKNYKWMDDVRAVLKDGTVTDVGFYDYYGRVVVNGKEYPVIDSSLSADHEEHSGFIIIDKVYQILKDNVEYDAFIKKTNLYDAIKDYKWKSGVGLLERYIHHQEVIVTTPLKKEKYSRAMVTNSPESYMFIDPDVSSDNYERIDELISLLIDNYL